MKLRTKLLTSALFFSMFTPIIAENEFTVSIKELAITGPGVDISLDDFNYSVDHPSMALSGIPLQSLLTDDTTSTPLSTTDSEISTSDLKHHLMDMELQAAYFLLRNDTTFVRSHNEVLWKTRETLDQLRDTQITTEQYDILVTALDSCSRSFDTMVELKINRGLIWTNGLEGEFRIDLYALFKSMYNVTSDSTVEDSKDRQIESLNIQVQFLEMRRVEKDYLLRRDDQFVDRHKRNCDSLKVLLNTYATDNAFETIPLLERYRLSFESLVTIDGEINRAISIWRNARFEFQDLIDQL